MVGTPAYRDPLHTAIARVEQLEREKAELLEMTAGVRRARMRRRAGIAAAFVTLLVAGPALAWVIRGAIPPAPETRTFEGRYTLHNWSTTASSATPTGPMTLTIDPKTGKGQGWATGPIGSVRISAQMTDRNADLIVFGQDGESVGMGGARLVGDAMSGSFGVPKMAASAGFVVEAKPR